MADHGLQLGSACFVLETDQLLEFVTTVDGVLQRAAWVLASFDQLFTGSRRPGAITCFHLGASAMAGGGYRNAAAYTIAVYARWRGFWLARFDKAVADEAIFFRFLTRVLFADRRHRDGNGNTNY